VGGGKGQAGVPVCRRPVSSLVELLAVLKTMVSGYEAHGGDGAGRQRTARNRLAGDQEP